MRKYIENHRVFGPVGVTIATIIAGIYIVLPPPEAQGEHGIQRLILEYGHSLCWALLGVASLIWAVKKRNKWIGTFAYAALAVYVVFMVTLLLSKA